MRSRVQNLSKFSDSSQKLASPSERAGGHISPHLNDKLHSPLVFMRRERISFPIFLRGLSLWTYEFVPESVGRT
jgi:hypothetical protein